MRTTTKALLTAAIFLLAEASASAEMLTLTPEKGDPFQVYWEKVPGATATVVLLAGGEGKVVFKEGKPRGANFLIRTFSLFAGQKLNVAVVGAREGVRQTYEYRVSDEATSNLALVAKTVRGLSPEPVWLVGTSRGTVSATAAAIRYDGQKLFDGIALTSAVVGTKKAQAISRQDAEKIHVPVLIYMHQNDGCIHCDFSDAKRVIKSFTGAPVRALIGATGGSGPSGDPCGNQHYHGFVGMEEQAVAEIAAWINKPVASN